MRKMALFAIIISLLITAGCTSAPSQNTLPGVVSTNPAPTGGAIGIPTSIVTITPGTALPMNAEVALGTAEKPFNVSIYSIEIDPPDESGKHVVNIYVGAKNTGAQPRNLTWFSKLTDINGKTYGGIGVSHAGNGARTRDVWPNTTEAARDYIVINNDKDFTTLSRGAVLDVYFLEYRTEGSPLIPDYHTAWIINPSVIR